MNAREYACQILHAEIRRRVDPDENTGLDPHPQLTNQIVLFRKAIDEGVSELDIILELTRFGATYALMPRVDSDPLAAVRLMEQLVMAEPDEPDET
jgi:hypothetical protein